MDKKILLIIASRDFQQIEYSGTREELEAAGLEVVVGSDKFGEAIGKDGVTKVNVDVAIQDINISDYNGIFLIGGPGALEYLDNEKVYDLLTRFRDTGKQFGAICISTRILAHAGLLKDKKATGWNGDGQLPHILNESGAFYTGTPVFTDGDIVTGEDPEAAHLFGKEIANQYK